MAESTARDTEEVIEYTLPARRVVADHRDTMLTIHQRVHAIMCELAPIEKGDVHDIKKDGKLLGSFAYISHDDVTAHVRPYIIKYGVMVHPTVTGKTINGNRTELDVSVKFINIDEPENFIEVIVPGFGVDTSDKGPGKALSYAVKYAYLKLFMLNTGEDIEAYDVEHVRADSGDELAKAELESKENLEAAARNYRAALETCKSLDELKELKKENKKLVGQLPDITKAFFIKLITDTENRLS